MAKKVIKLTEAQLKSVVEKVIMEQGAPAPQAQGTTPKLAPGQELIKGKDGRSQARRYALNMITEFDRDVLIEGLTNFAKQVPVYQTKLRKTAIVRLKDLGLKMVNTPGYFKNTGDDGTLTHTFTLRFYYFDEPKTRSSKDQGRAVWYDVVYYIGASNPKATAQDILNDINGGTQGLVKHIKFVYDGQQESSVPDQYVALRQILPAKNVVVLIARATGMDEEYISIWMKNTLWWDSDNEEPDMWGQTGGQKYKSYYDELKKLYSLDSEQ